MKPAPLKYLLQLHATFCQTNTFPIRQRTFPTSAMATTDHSHNQNHHCTEAPRRPAKETASSLAHLKLPTPGTQRFRRAALKWKTREKEGTFSPTSQPRRRYSQHTLNFLQCISTMIVAKTNSPSVCPRRSNSLNLFKLTSTRYL